MTDLSRFAWIGLLLAFTLHPRSAPAQTDAHSQSVSDSGGLANSLVSDSAPSAPAKEAGDNHVETLLGGLSLSGYAEASYSYSTEPSGADITGRIFDRMQDQAMLNGLVVVLDKPYDPAGFSAGFHAELLLGQNASVIKSSGFSLGDHGDVPHLYGTLNIPTPNGNGVQVKFGRMVTLLGLEVIEDVLNPNWSEGYQFIYVENFTALGLSLEHKFNRYLDAQIRVTNGWDVVQDNNSRKSFMGRLGVYPDERSSISLVGYIGPEQVVDSSANRYGLDVVINRKVGSRSSVWLQADYGQEEANAALPVPGEDAKWWALGAWLTHDFAPAFGLAFRADYLDDRNGARTSGVFGFPLNSGLKVGSGTLTGNIRAWPQVLVRPEIRYDRSDSPAFDGEKDQTTFSLSAAYSY